MEFRHPNSIQEQISRLLTRRTEVETEMSKIAREDPRSAKLLVQLTVIAGALMALEWSACQRLDFDEDLQQLIEALP